MTAERRVTLSRRALLAGSLPAMAIASARAENGAETYPERQVSFIVPFAPGGGTDFSIALPVSLERGDQDARQP